MTRVILHIDFNSYFATVEQQANPRLRGKPIGVTGGDRTERTVIGAASIEAKKFGVKTGMALWQAKQICPNIILVPGDSDKYLETTKRFLNILKDYSPYVEIFSIDECFMELPVKQLQPVIPAKEIVNRLSTTGIQETESTWIPYQVRDDKLFDTITIAKQIKSRIRFEIGEWISCSIGISYNKLLAKLAGSLQKPDGLIVIANQDEAIRILDQIELDEICGIGSRIKNRLFNLGVTNFKQLRQVPLEALLASFKSYGLTLYNMSWGIDERAVQPFFEKEEVKSIGHRLTLNHDTKDPEEIKQVLLKLSELVARRLRAKQLMGKTISCWIRYSLVIPAKETVNRLSTTGIQKTWIPDQVRDDSTHTFNDSGMQLTISFTNDGLALFKAGWGIFHRIWNGQPIRMIGVSISNLKPALPENLSLLPEDHRKEVIIAAIDKVNDKYGEFTVQRGILLQSANIKRMPNPFLSDRRFKV